MNNLFFSHNVKFLLTVKKMSHDDLADKTKLFRNMWGRRNLSRRISSGIKVSLEEAKDIADALKVSPGNLCFMEAQQFREKYGRKDDK